MDRVALLGIVHRRSFLMLINLLLLLLFCSFSPLTLANEGFPGRDIYPKVKTLSIDELHEKMQDNKAIVIDVRSDFEFRTLNIVGAIHLSVAKKNFPEKLKSLRASTTTDIVFYCNGRSCYKSYRAAMKAIKYGVADCYAYDAGIFEWTKQHPDTASLLGVSPVKESSLISKETFQAHLLSVDEFEKQILNEKAKVYDIRDREQRRGSSGLFMFRDKSVGLDNSKKLTKIIDDAIKNETTLYFYDMKGKQVRWLQYLLEQEGLSNYFFMDGGAGAYFKVLRERQKL